MFLEIGDALKHARTELSTKLRYAPKWTGTLTITAYVKANLICKIETSAVVDEIHRMVKRSIPEGSDQQETNREAVETLSREMRMAYTELLKRAAPENPVFGRVVSQLQVRNGYIIALDVQRVVRLLNQCQPL